MKQRWQFILLLTTMTMVVAMTSAQTRSGKVGVGIAGIGGMLSGSDRTDVSLGMGAGLSTTYSLTEMIGLRTLAGFSQLNYKDAAKLNAYTNMFSLSGALSFDMAPNSTFNPYLLGGISYNMIVPMDSKNKTYQTGGISTDMALTFGGGFDYFLSEFWSISVQGEYLMPTVDTYDGLHVAGTSKDNVLRGSVQIRYYFFDQAFITKLLEAQAERYSKK